MRVAAIFMSMILSASAASAQTPMLGRDWKKAIWRAPLHILASVPVAATTFVIPPVGKAYVKWRIKAESVDASSGRDTSGKAAIDLYTQTALVRVPLKLYHVKTD